MSLANTSVLDAPVVRFLIDEIRRLHGDDPQTFFMDHAIAQATDMERKRDGMIHVLKKDKEELSGTIMLRDAEINALKEELETKLQIKQEVIDSLDRDRKAFFAENQRLCAVVEATKAENKTLDDKNKKLVDKNKKLAKASEEKYMARGDDLRDALRRGNKYKYFLKASNPEHADLSESPETSEDEAPAARRSDSD